MLWVRVPSPAPIKEKMNEEITKMLMRYKKDWLKQIAIEMNLDDSGNKVDIARRISEERSKQYSRMWDVISGKDEKNGKEG